jgi:predicted Holliday junction resolvase-like endonuclease
MPHRAPLTNYTSTEETPAMNGFYKWIIGGLCVLLLTLGTTYINNTNQSVREQTQQLLNHEQRITTLEESKRHQEKLLEDIQRDIRQVRDAIIPSSATTR